jgi:hypothetical protein
MPKKLILNADDYGRTPSVSTGIRQTHLNGILTSTTAMMNMAAIESDLHLALAECPRLGMGVHLTLTAEKPVLSPERLPSLARLAPDGQSFPKLEVLTKQAATVNTAEVKAEWRAQIEKFSRLMGRTPTHLDSHHHSSYFTPEFFGAMLELAREYQCGIRNPLAGEIGMDTVVREMPELQFLRPMLLAATDVRRPDHFEAAFYDDNANASTLDQILAHLPEGVTEIMTHPGLADEKLVKLTSYSHQRARELEVLTAPGVREKVKALGIELISFAGLE